MTAREGDKRAREGGERAREASTLRKICSLKISICKCDTAGALSPRLFTVQLSSAQLGSAPILDLHFALSSDSFYPPTGVAETRAVSPVFY